MIFLIIIAILNKINLLKIILLIYKQTISFLLTKINTIYLG